MEIVAILSPKKNRYVNGGPGKLVYLYVWCGKTWTQGSTIVIKGNKRINENLLKSLFIQSPFNTWDVERCTPAALWNWKDEIQFKFTISKQPIREIIERSNQHSPGVKRIKEAVESLTPRFQ